jgi:hypothetical protein
MTTVSIRYTNSGPRPVILQIEPWAGVYRLSPGEGIEIVAESTTEAPTFELNEDGETRYLTIVHSSEYFILREGKRCHWSDYPNSGFD